MAFVNANAASALLLLALHALSVPAWAVTATSDRQDAAAATNSGGSPDLSYGRYPSYPPYCSTPSAMKSRSIPPLRPPEEYAPHGVAGTELRQVVAIIRHGARTPWSPRMSCWDGYWTDPETGIWDCELTTLTAPPSPPFVAEVEVDPSEVNDAFEAREGEDAMFLFEKRYDALNHPPQLANGMNGTCQIGQLLLRGYEQEMANGWHLRDAYVYDGSGKSAPAADDEKMRLFDLTHPSERRPYEPPNLHYRVDDEQRTLMSGQVLLRGLFGDLLRSHKDELGEDPVVVTHTADYSYDVLAPRSNICPRLNDLRDEAEKSDEFQAFNTSQEAAVLGKMMTESMGADFMDNAIDCLMTTICTDRLLPDPINDYRGELDRAANSDANDGGDDGGDAPNSQPADPPPPSSSRYDDSYGPHRFARLIDFAVRRHTYHLTHNDAAYSKLGMGPLWKEILDQIMTVLKPEGGRSRDLTYDPSTDKVQKGSEGGSEDAEEGPTKLALFSGHDSTLMPLLATLGRDVFDGSEWSPYASMVIIEIHEITKRTNTDRNAFPSDHAFRLLYNGDVLTPRMEGCPPDLDLCDVSVLLDRVGPFATLDRDCDSALDGDAESFKEEMEEAAREAEDMLGTLGGALLFFLAVATSATLGAAGMYVHLMRKLNIKSAGGGGSGTFYGSFYNRGSTMGDTGGTKATGGMTSEEESCSEGEWVYGDNDGGGGGARGGNVNGGGGEYSDDRISWQLT